MNPGIATTVSDSEEELVWSLLVRNIPWEPPASLPIEIVSRAKDKRKRRPGRTMFQLFEVLTTMTLALMRPAYSWAITPLGPDGGIDFLGRSQFLEDEFSGISAYITIGGQCKKRRKANTVDGLLFPSLGRMRKTADPTFFLVFLSLPVSSERIAEAQRTIELSLNRHCHILGRRQIESLFRSNLSALRPLLDRSLADHEVETVVRYLNREAGDGRTACRLELRCPRQVLAGEIAAS